MLVGADDEEKDKIEDENENKEEDEELDELESRLIPDEGPVNDAMTEVKHKLEISQQLFKIAGSMKHKRPTFQCK